MGKCHPHHTLVFGRHVDWGGLFGGCTIYANCSATLLLELTLRGWSSNCKKSPLNLRICTTVLFIKEKNWKQLKYPLVDISGLTKLC